MFWQVHIRSVRSQSTALLEPPLEISIYSAPSLEPPAYAHATPVGTFNQVHK
jgi:hypothetical protein